mgnify:CR=1 FL=1
MGNGEGVVYGMVIPADIQGQVGGVHGLIYGPDGFQNFIILFCQMPDGIFFLMEGVHDMKKADARLIEHIDLSFLSTAVEEGVTIIEGAQLYVEGTGGEGKQLEVRFCGCCYV